MKKKYMAILGMAFILAACEGSSIHSRNDEMFEERLDAIEERLNELEAVREPAVEAEGNEGAACTTDRDCVTPMDYLIRSSCPYGSMCLDGECSVVCAPLPAGDREGKCETADDCTCENTPMSPNDSCSCINNTCMIVVGKE